jgi:hypothetical protein
MKNYTNDKYHRAHHVDTERKVVTVFTPSGGSVALIKEVGQAYPHHLVQFTQNFNVLEALHGED